jgi:transcriptional regulator with XRE-family HTH domain
MKRLALIRREKGLTQRELGNLAGIDSNTISRYEHGRLIPTITAVARLARTLGVSIDALVGDENE